MILTLTHFCSPIMHCDPCQFDLCDACVAWVQSSTKLVVPMESLAPPSLPAPPRNASPIPAAAKNTAIVGMSLVHFIQGDTVICITLFTGSFLGFVSAEKKAAAIAAAAGIHCSAPGCTNGADPLSGILAFQIFILTMVRCGCKRLLSGASWSHHRWPSARASASAIFHPTYFQQIAVYRSHPSHVLQASFPFSPPC